MEAEEVVEAVATAVAVAEVVDAEEAGLVAILLHWVVLVAGKTRDCIHQGVLGQ